VLSAALLEACGNYDPEPRSAPANPTALGQLNGAGGSNGGGPANGGSAGMLAAGGSAGQASGDGAMLAAGGSAQANGAGGSAAIPEASCENVMACGGALIGTWSALDSCLPVTGQADLTGFGLNCTSAPISGSLQVTGTWTAREDGTLTDNTTTAGTLQLELPAECLNISGTTTTCDRVGGPLQALGFSSVNCTPSASGGCSCSAGVQQSGGIGFVSFDASSGGTYMTAADALTTSDRRTTEYAYCVSGTTLTLTPRSTGKTGTVAGTIVLQKQ
jgi:hypothetical protein